MKRLLALILLAALAFFQAPANAQTRIYSQAELDALLAPIALHPDGVLSNILVAATQSEDLREAAAWSRGNPQLAGDDALRAAEPYLWHPSVKSLVAFPEVLARMDESPQWTADLGAAFVSQEPQVMETVQALRRRAQASGYLQSNDQYSVQRQGDAIAVYPAQPQVVYVPYYNPYVVYGPWWWHAYRPVYWRPWHPRPAVFVSFSFVRTSVDWHHRHVHRHHQVHVQRHNHIQHQHHARPQSAPAVHARNPVQVREHRQESRHDRRSDRAQHVRPIVQGAQLQPTPSTSVHNHANQRVEQRREDRNEQRNQFRGAPVVQHNNPAQHARPAAREHRQESRGQHRQESRGQHRGNGRG